MASHAENTTSARAIILAGSSGNSKAFGGARAELHDCEWREIGDMASKRPSAPETIVVTGDVVLDWLEIAQPRQWQGVRNFELFPGFNWTCVWGGAALIERMLKYAIKAEFGTADHLDYDGALASLNSPRTRLAKSSGLAPDQYLQSLAIVTATIGERSAADKTPIARVDQFKGFTTGSDSTKNRTIPPLPTTKSRVACLVVDDAANGCRHDAKFRRKFAELSSPRRTRRIVIKLSRPLQPSALILALAKRGPAKNQQVVIIVNADDLRAQGMDVSWRLSWERTATDIASLCNAPGMLRKLSEVGDVLVRLGNDGCVVLPRRGQWNLVFDPRRTEDGFDQELAGTMPGATSAFVASITASLLSSDPDLVRATRKALTAARKLLKAGFQCSKDSIDDYPLEIFDPKQLPEVEDVFEDVLLPHDKRTLKTWSILSSRL